ncbi:hypothetical protein FPOAC2_04503 [Fusarium poae]|uniref:hypothetical protein n=1 Tax=Fusarium poae TaxID=36050 RepID=UPI001CE921D7|nr:hypothetical protein FPOAC1_004419 [Fusarium poae]KAG8671180.1 hypothetical protein FPOAC1_004419 [Fusarium poae]
MGGPPKFCVPRRLRRLFKKRKESSRDVELRVISRPFDVYRIDSKGEGGEIARATGNRCHSISPLPPMGREKTVLET